MKAAKIFFSFCFVVGSLYLLSSCSANRIALPNSVAGIKNANHFSSGDQCGSDRVFTNGNFVMWVPLHVAHIWDGHTSVVDVDETTFPGAFVKDYKIVVEIQISDTPEEFKQMEQWGASDWYFQDHPELSVIDVQYGKQMRKDIWNSERTRRFLINAMIKKSDTFQADVETAKKMVESVQLISK